MRLLPRPALFAYAPLGAALAVALAWAASLPSAQAATVYRCGAAGNVYSDQPCAEGRPVQASDPRTEDQRLDGQRIAALELRHASDLQRERLRREAAPLPQAIGIGLRPAPAAPVAERLVVASKHKRQRPRAARWPAEGADFVAMAPGRAARP